MQTLPDQRRALGLQVNVVAPCADGGGRKVSLSSAREQRPGPCAERGQDRRRGVTEPCPKEGAPGCLPGEVCQGGEEGGARPSTPAPGCQQTQGLRQVRQGHFTCPTGHVAAVERPGVPDKRAEEG